MDDSVTVVTISRNRPRLLQRCIESVSKQDHQGTLKHLIVVDDCATTMAWLTSSCLGNGAIRNLLAKRTSLESSGPPRLARLRNYAASLVDTTWTAFLDDDNEYESNHISSLLRCARATDSSAVHSHRKLLTFEGAPFLEQRWPWCRDSKQAEQRYQELVEKGVLQVGSNVVRDRVDTSPGRSYILLVDTSEWLIKAEVLRKIKIPATFSHQDWIDNLAEDDKLLEALASSGTRIACSGMPSLRYYLGGYSNDLDGKYPHSERWAFNGDLTG